MRHRLISRFNAESLWLCVLGNGVQRQEGGFLQRGIHQALPIQCKVALTIKEAAEYSNIGINKLESLLRSPRCPFVLYVGKKKLVKRKEFEKFISDNVEI